MGLMQAITYDAQRHDREKWNHLVNHVHSYYMCHNLFDKLVTVQFINDDKNTGENRSEQKCFLHGESIVKYIVPDYQEYFLIVEFYNNRLDFIIYEEDARSTVLVY